MMLEIEPDELIIRDVRSTVLVTAGDDVEAVSICSCVEFTDDVAAALEDSIDVINGTKGTKTDGDLWLDVSISLSS